MTDLNQPRVGDIYAEESSGEGHIIPNLSTAPYTPTTEEIRWQFSTDSPSEFMPEQFDRWLADVKAQERQKLIAELEQGQIDAERASRRPDDEPYVWGFRKAVAVAKGETE